MSVKFNPNIDEHMHRNKEIRDMFHAGQSVNNIAAKYGITVFQVIGILGMNSVPEVYPNLIYSSTSLAIKATDDIMSFSGVKDAYIEQHTETNW